MDKSGKTALHYCAENQNLACIEQILGAQPELLNQQDEEGYTPLHLSVISGNKAVLKHLISRGADVNAVDNERHSAVHWATGKTWKNFCFVSNSFPVGLSKIPRYFSFRLRRYFVFIQTRQTLQ